MTEDCPWHVAGYSFSGVPGIVIGQNARVAWGLTNLGPDVADLYVEQIDGDRYRTGDGWQDLEIIEDTLRVAGGDDVPLTVRATRHGPLFSDVHDGGTEVAAGPQGAAAADANADAEYAVALRWTALDPGTTMDAVAGLMRARAQDVLRQTFNEELPDWAAPTGGARWWEFVRELAARPEAPWWDDVQTTEVETRDEILASALTAGHQETVERFGDDPDDWRWGEMHTLTLTHASFGESGIAPVEALFDRGPVETSGGTGIVNATGWNAAEGYEVSWVPSMRYLVDTSDMDAGRWVHLTGQSGRPFHAHYTDRIELWRDGGTIPLPFSPDAVEAAAENTLTITPAD